MLDELPKARRTAALLILRTGEGLIALLVAVAVVYLVYLASNGSDVLWMLGGVWGSITFLGFVVGSVWLFWFMELELDPRIYKHEGELLPAPISWLAVASIILAFIAPGVRLLFNSAHAHYIDYEILDGCGLVFIDVIGVSVTTCLSLAQRRLNRAAHTPHD